MKIAICDDEKEFGMELISFLKPYQEENKLVLEMYHDGEALVSDWNRGKHFDLIFLDIGMKNMNGIDAASMIRSQDENVMIFFITSYDSYVTDAFRLNAFQYLEKPLDEKEFNLEFERALAVWKKRNKAFMVHWYGVKNPVKIKDIVYVESCQRRIFIHTIADKYQMNEKLGVVEKELKPYGFLRIHQSFLVNMAYIKSFTGYTIEINGGSIDYLQVSKKLCSEARKEYIEYRNQVFL